MRNFKALDDVNFNENGRIVGLIGPNGAGKQLFWKHARLTTSIMVV